MNSITHRHSTLFMLDLEATNGEEATMQDFISREPDYDLAFCEAWNTIDIVKNERLPHSKQLLELLDKIQKVALGHLPLIRVVGSGYQKIHGRADGLNYFGLFNNTPNSNEEGITDIIKKIWVNRESFGLQAMINNHSRYVLTDNNLTLISENKNKVLFCNNTNSNKETFSEIAHIFLSLYKQGLFENERARIILMQNKNATEREIEALQILDIYFKEIKTKDKAVEKIETISCLIRDLMQLHLFYDGNGRSLYLLANLLLYQNDLPLFYPKNMCMFDGNGVDTMVEEILGGQQRFVSMFGSQESLTNSLREYKEAITQLKSFINKNFPSHPALNKSINERNLNLLFRQSVTAPNNDLLKLLLSNKEIIGIDIFSKGLTSGNALMIAQKRNNPEAISLLNAHGLND